MKQLSLDEVQAYTLQSRLNTLIKYHMAAIRINGVPTESSRALAFDLGTMALGILSVAELGSKSARRASKAIEWLEQNYSHEMSEVFKVHDN